MNKFRFLWTLLAAGLIPLLMGSSCGNNSPYGMPTRPGGQSAAVTIGAAPSGGSFVFSPSTATITHGQAVQWNISTIHPLNIDDGSGTCLVSGTTAFPYTYTFMTAGTYHFHCGVHSSCGNGNCPNPSTCSGMVGTITVN